MTKPSILEEALEVVKRKRPDQYGHPFDHHGRTIGMINALLGEAFLKRPLETKHWSMFMILDKQAREMHAHKRDNPRDTAGYAECMVLVVEEEARRS